MGMSSYEPKAVPTNLDVPIGALKTQLSKLLMSFDRIGWKRNCSSGRLDMRRINRLMTGAERVFKMRTEDKAVKTVVSIVVDLSSSMDGYGGGLTYKEMRLTHEEKQAILYERCQDGRSRAAARCAWALATAIERVDCDVEVMGFRTSRGNYFVYGMESLDAGESIGTAYESNRGGYSQGKCVMFKTFNEKATHVRENFEYLHVCVNGSTPDYHVVRTAAENLSSHTAQRRIVISITDGCGDMKLMKKFCAYAEEHMDTMVLAIGIQTHPGMMKKAYNRFACVKDVEDLGKGAIKALIDQIKARDLEKTLANQGLATTAVEEDDCGVY